MNRARSDQKIERTASPAIRPVRSGGWRRFIFFSCGFLAMAGLALVLFVLITGGSFDDLNPQNKILELTDQDRDPETTLISKNLLRQNQMDPMLAITLWSDAHQALSGPELAEAEIGLRQGQVNSALRPLIKKLSDDFEVGRAAAFTIWVQDDEERQGASVDLNLNGALLGRFAAESTRYGITIVQRTGATSRLQITGSAGSRGGFVFRAQTATSEAETRHLHAKQTDSWQIIVR